MAVSSESMDTRADAKLMTLAALIRGLSYRLYLKILIIAKVTAVNV